MERLKRLLTYFITIPCVAIAPACVTSGDLQRITQSLAEVERVAADASATNEDFEDALDDMGDTIADVSEDVKTRTEDILKTATGAGGTIGVLSTLGLNLYRNSTRKRVLESKVS